MYPFRETICTAYHSIFVNVYHFYKDQKGYGRDALVFSKSLHSTLNSEDEWPHGYAKDDLLMVVLKAIVLFTVS